MRWLAQHAPTVYAVIAGYKLIMVSVGLIVMMTGIWYASNPCQREGGDMREFICQWRPPR